MILCVITTFLASGFFYPEAITLTTVFYVSPWVVLLAALVVIIYQQILLNQYKANALKDALTGCMSPFAGAKALQQEFERANRLEQDLSLVMIDLNNFKLVNDLLGHHMGDNVLRKAVQKLHSKRRVYDILYRKGGDEFVMILPQTSEHEAKSVVDRLQAELQIKAEGKHTIICVTGSFGVACLQKEESIEQLLERADKAMYAHKNALKESGILAENVVSALAPLDEDNSQPDNAAPSRA